MNPKTMIKTTTLILAVLCLVFTSCTTDVEVNTPALQAKINGEVFRPSLKKATIYEDGTLVISGTAGDQSISFTTTSNDIGVYKFEQKTVNKVSFEKEQVKFVSEDGKTQGTVNITEIYNNEISGNFHFDNLKDENGNTTSFKDGWFYRLPIENGFIEEEVLEEINPCLLNASLTANIDGSELITDDHSAQVFGVEDVSILIKATDESGEITIVFPIHITPGEFPLTGSGDYSATYTAGKDKSSALSGNLIITSHNADTKCISGSFEFETRSGVIVSQGIFDFGY